MWSYEQLHIYTILNIEVSMNYNPMKALILSVFASLVAFQLHAQNTYTEKLRQNEAGKGSVIINHSPEIDNVVNHGNKKKVQQPLLLSITQLKRKPTRTQRVRHIRLLTQIKMSTKKRVKLRLHTQIPQNLIQAQLALM